MVQIEKKFFLFRAWSLIVLFLLVGAFAGGYYYFDGYVSKKVQAVEAPPSLDIGATLLKGQATTSGLVKYDDADKRRTRSGSPTASVRKGVGFYYTEENMTLAELLDPAKCMNANVNRTLFLTYSPGKESGMENAGFYLYPSVLASGQNRGISSPENFTIKKGRVFGLYSDNAVNSHCFKDAEKLSDVSSEDVFEDLTDGWVQFAASDNDLADVLGPISFCVTQVWLQDRDDRFGKRVKQSEQASATFGDFKLLWVKLKDCGGAGDAGGGDGGAGGGDAADVEVSLASNNPAGAEIAQGEGKDVLVFTLESDKDVSLKEFSLRWNGSMTKSDFESVQIRQGRDRFNDGMANDSDHKIKFGNFNSGGLSLDSGSKVTFTIRLDVANDAIAGHGGEFSLASGDVVFVDSGVQVGGLPIKSDSFVVAKSVEGVAVSEEEAAEPIKPGIVKDFNVTSGDKVVFLSWKAPDNISEEDIWYYDVVVEVDGVALGLTDTDTAVKQVDGSFLRTEEVPAELVGKMVTFSIRAVSEARLTGDFSEKKSVKVLDYKPGIVQNFDAGIPEFVPQTEAEEWEGKVKITWDPLIYEAGALKYEIHYGSDFSEEESSAPKSVPGNDRKIILEDMEKGKYWFKIRAIGEVDGEKYEGDFSPEIEYGVT